MHIKDLTGNMYGKLTVISLSKLYKGKAWWHCNCACGESTVVVGSSLTKGFTKSCGCIRKEVKSLVGCVFGTLTVLADSGERKDRHPVWECRCECGKIVSISGKSLKSGNTKSCGCMHLGVRVAHEEKKPRVLKNPGGVGDTFGRLTILIDKYGKDKYDGNTVLCSCTCGSIVSINKQAVLTGNTRSCGCLRLETMRRLGTEMFTGRKGILSFRYNHNKTDIEREEARQYPAYYEWRSSVFTRDNYTCQVCNKVGGNINAHHLEDYASFKELRTVLSNGVTLCAECHKKFHKLYGKQHKNFAWQFDEFKHAYGAF